MDNSLIIAFLKYLNYYNINFINEKNNFIINELKLLLNNNIELFDDIPKLITHIQQSDKYYCFINTINYKIKRAIELSKFITSGDINDFYLALSNTELSSLKLLTNNLCH